MDYDDEHNKLMSPEFAAIKAEILTRKGWAKWHLDVNYHNELVFIQGDPADVFGLCYLMVHPAATYHAVDVRTKTHYAEFKIPLDDPASIHKLLDDLADAKSSLWIPRNRVQFLE